MTILSFRAKRGIGRLGIRGRRIYPLRDIDHKMTEFIHLHSVTRINEYRRAHFFDHRRTFETIAGS